MREIAYSRPMRSYVCGLTLVLLAGIGVEALGQVPASPARVSGVDEFTGASYTLLILEGKTLPPVANAPTVDPAAAVPVLVAQCSQPKDPSAKVVFEVFMTFGGVGDEARHFQGSWRPTAPNHLSKPPLVRTNLTVEFLGYVKEKPQKLEWERMRGLDGEFLGEFRFLPPGFHSANLGDFNYYIRYLLALPTMRVSWPGQPVVEFGTAPWLDTIRKEPLCKASGL
jgi:hypothetical protein